MLCARVQCSPRLVGKKARGLTIVNAKTRLDNSGFVQNDNSGKGNIFPTAQKAFYSSPTSASVAKQGLGGASGGAVLAAAIAVVGLATVGVVSTGTGETLNQVQGADIESLAAIASRIAASL